jgi:ABC-type transport system involved in multi-copper enzyme maturation permease subunit
VTWFAWRTQRLQVLVAIGAVAVIAVMLVITGEAYRSAASSPLLTSPSCSTGLSLNCANAFSRLGQANRWVGYAHGLVLAFPALVGVLVGAPIVASEMAHGTNRLAWAQSVSRTRWLAVKLLLSGLAIAVAVGAIVPLLAWWAGASQISRLYPGDFDVTGTVVLGYTLFAFMLGAALGAVIQRVGWAIAAALGVFVGARLWVESFRAHLVAPVSVVLPNGIGPLYSATGLFSVDSPLARGWVLNQGYVALGRTTPAPGQTWTTEFERFQNCFLSISRPRAEALSQCSAQLKLHYVIQYQPLSHYWALQGAESAVFVGAALILLGVTVLAVRRWRT